MVFLFFKMVLGIAVGVENYRKVWGDILGWEFDLVGFGLLAFWLDVLQWGRKILEVFGI
ncbi:MAG: hypothetical protein ACQES9_07555 [Myxococcota bacterium]